MTELARLVDRHVNARGDTDGFAVSAVEGVGMVRAHAPTGINKAIYRPLVCLVLQGAKQVTVGPDTWAFSAGHSALVSADVAVVSRVTKASRAEPYLSLLIELDTALLAELSAEVGAADVALPPVLLDETDPAMADCALRLGRLAERPEAIPVLRPGLMRELHYWLLQGRHGPALRTLARPESAANRIARAVAVLRRGYNQPLPVEHLASVAGMSVSSFHHHFRAVTSLSPLQFQKHLRLIEARRRMVNDGLPASRAAFAVGYESVSQFTREYGRMFGTPPGRDMRASRAA